MHWLWLSIVLKKSSILSNRLIIISKLLLIFDELWASGVRQTTIIMVNRVISLRDNLAPRPFHLRVNLGTEALTYVSVYPRHRQDEDSFAGITKNIRSIIYNVM